MGLASSKETTDEENSMIYTEDGTADGTYSSSVIKYAYDHGASTRKKEVTTEINQDTGEEVQRLMAYLRDVAENSDDLPKSRRDDPDLGRIVSTITGEGYAKKTEAFFPADIRIFGGVFTKYPKVWDLPTCEEFVLSDGAQEPGLTYGGAVCNALLKVVYDGNSFATKSDGKVNTTFINPDDLFDDDNDDVEEQVDEDNNLNFEDRQPDLVKTFTSISSLTWSEVLKRMKGVMADIGFVQNPILTSSRKMDLEESFIIVPEHFDSTKNRKRALLIGVNYNDSLDSKLTTSHDDVKSVKQFLCNCHDFPDEGEDMIVLLDDGVHKNPTRDNIIDAFRAIAASSEPGDAVWVSFSGHGCRILDIPISSDVEGYDEIIVPSDFRQGQNTVIRDTLIFSTLLAKFPKGVTVTCLFDACDKGFVLDLPYAWSHQQGQIDSAKMKLNETFSFLRFLKATKSMYDSSVFHHVGLSMNKALDNNRDAYEDHSYDDSSTGSLITVDDSTFRKVKTGILNGLVHICNYETVVDTSARSKGEDSSTFVDIKSGCGIIQPAKV